MKQMHYLFSGYPFSGKSTLQKKLQERFGFEILSIDELKFEKGYKEASDDNVPDEVWSEDTKRLTADLLRISKLARQSSMIMRG